MSEPLPPDEFAADFPRIHEMLGIPDPRPAWMR